MHHLIARRVVGQARQSTAITSSSSSNGGKNLFAATAAQHQQRQQTRSMILRAQTATGGKGPLMAGQDSLPALPVPPLEKTFEKYLRTTLPLQKDAQSKANTEAAVQSALSGADAALFKKLQERLIKRAEDPQSDKNWLAAWWNDVAYMGYREPVVPYISYFYALKDDKARRTASKRASSLLKAMLKFRQLVESEQLAPEKTKTGPMCSGSYPWMFNSTRIPVKPIDQAKKYLSTENNHVVVVRNGRFYEFNLVHADGQELSAVEIEAQLDNIIAASKEATSMPVGALTSQNRDLWTDGRDALLNVAGPGGKQNAATLERIESSVVVLCIDDTKPVTIEDRTWEYWWGDGKNRFYDKQQFIVSQNGKVGYMGEHSVMDGTPTLRMNDFLINALAAGKIDLGTSNKSDLPAPLELTFALDGKIEGMIGQAIKDFEALKSQHDAACLEMTAYGKDAIKKFKCSPDAWAQMVIQLAYIRMNGKPAPTYESAQTRKFKWGRTEVIRSCSQESKAFCQAMDDANATDEERYEKFQAATKQHLSYAKEAADGHGVDRHLFGLKQVLAKDEQLPALYRDWAYGESSTWRLSTSQISSETFDGWGYGEVVPDGFGCAYAIRQDRLTFTLTSRKLGAATLRHYLHEAALDLRDLHLRLAAKQQSGSGEKAKL